MEHLRNFVPEVAEHHCDQEGCACNSLVEWRSARLCVPHFLESAKGYVDYGCSWEAYQGKSGRVADPDVLAACIFQVARLLAGPTELERAQQAELFRLLSFCHGLLRMSVNHKTKFAPRDGSSRADQPRLASAATSR